MFGIKVDILNVRKKKPQYRIYTLNHFMKPPKIGKYLKFI